jgi:hypothetical protein
MTRASSDAPVVFLKAGLFEHVAAPNKKLFEEPKWLRIAESNL